MKKMRKQILAVAAALLVVSMAACSAKPASSSGSGNTQKEETEAVTAEATTAEAETAASAATTAEAVTTEAAATETAATEAMDTDTMTDPAMEEENDPGHIYVENAGLRLPVPVEFAELVVVDAPEDGDYVFRVSEKASLDAAAAKGITDTDGVGELFRIRVLNQEEYDQLVSEDLPGITVFGTDAEGNWYLYQEPTDVRIEREDMSVLNDPESDDMLTWTTLREWSGMVMNSFLAYNDNVTDAPQ